MRLLPLSLLLVPALASAQGVNVPRPALQEAWEAPYAKADSIGAHVLGHWNFDGDAAAALKDQSGKGGDLTLAGAMVNSAGKSGGALESFPGFPVEDKSHGARTGQRPALSPKGAFTMEMWISTKPDFAPKQRCFLLDKKYVDHTDYQWQLSDAENSGQRRMTVNLGFGADSKAWHSEPVKLEPGIWHHIAFTYDGAGEGCFYVDGQSMGRLRQPGCAAVTPGGKPLSIGDRLGSNYGGFPGFIDEVRICNGVLNFSPVALAIESTRHVWRRMESARPIEVTVTNLKRTSLTGARLRMTIAGREQVVDVPELRPGKTYGADCAFNTSYKAGMYSMNARLEVAGSVTELTDSFELVARPLPHVMPVIMWGSNPEEADRLRDIGFTHCFGTYTEMEETWSQKKPAPPAKLETVLKNRRMLDEALSKNLSIVASVLPGNLLEHKTEYQRLDRQGKPFARPSLNASLPELPQFFENVGRSVGKAYGDHPAFASVLVSTEVRDGSAPSFNPEDVENYRKFAGTDIPAEVTGRNGVEWSKLKDFPQDRVIADDHPILKYYRWFWTVGDGWNALHSALHKGVKSTSPRVWTFFDPAVRQPSISGGGGSVDVLSHWTYTYPDPQRIGLCTDQLFAMSAANGRNQEVMKMTQIIWYRSQTAPVGQKAPGDVVAWQDHDPDAAYITIAPMHLREALWTKLSRPITGIMYHGWQSLVDIPGNTSSYRFTHAGTAPMLKQLIHDVVEPLGPTLLQIPDERSEVAFLESFTSQMFARRGGYGNNMSWATDVWLALQHSHVQCDVMFEETLLKTGLGGRRFLVMPECDVLTRSVVDKIAAWQKKGGKIIADEFLCPGLKADIVLASRKRLKKAAEDKAAVLDLAKTLGPQLKTAGYSQRLASDNPEIILRARRAGDAAYVFAINDQREAGSYVGQHGLVLENGLPSSGSISLLGENANVYDLNRGAQVLPIRTVDGTVNWKVELGPCDGRLFMVLPRPLMQLKLEAPETAKAGNQVTLSVEITDTTSRPVNAVVPVRVDVHDASGRSVEGTGCYGAKTGVLKVALDIASNEDPGMWQITVRELASRMEQTRYVRVTK